LGKHEKVEELLGTSDLMLMPSELESFGLAALEAMACEVPSISTRAGGVPELIEHGKNGMLAAVGDVEAMAKYAIELLSDDARLKTMGENARFEAQSRFCSTGIIPRYVEFYQKVVSSQ
jgi:glycosyltransferase involved in cell wall biosynthesis